VKENPYRKFDDYNELLKEQLTARQMTLIGHLIDAVYERALENSIDEYQALIIKKETYREIAIQGWHGGKEYCGGNCTCQADLEKEVNKKVIQIIEADKKRHKITCINRKERL